MKKYAVQRWAGTYMQLTGAVMLASHFGAPVADYVVMFGGSVLWLSVGILQKDMALVVLNGAYSVINIIGIFSWWNHR